MNNDKHAYLIIAHSQPSLLKTLIRCLDDENNDIFILFDKKSKIDSSLLKGVCKKSTLTFVKRIKIVWGGISLVKAALLLLEEATKGAYSYYHLISGQDLPLRSQKTIHDFFKEHNGQNFISCVDLKNTPFGCRIDYFYPFQSFGSGRSIIAKVWNKIIRDNHSWLKLKRKRKYAVYGCGSAWFSITHEFACFLVSKKEEALKNFRMTLLPDESWLQTLYLNSEFASKPGFKYVSGKHTEYIDGIMFDVLRAIDFQRGKPYTYREEDFEYLINSGCLFARKFDESVSGDLIEKIAKYCKS